MSNNLIQYRKYRPQAGARIVIDHANTIIADAAMLEIASMPSSDSRAYARAMLLMAAGTDANMAQAIGARIKKDLNK